MKITIPSRIAAPTAPPDVAAAAAQAPQASTSAGPSTSTATTAAATTGTTPKIRIKQSGGTSTAASTSAAPSAAAAAPSTTTSNIPEIKTEEGGASTTENNNNDSTAATTTRASSPSKNADNTGFNSSLILPGKRKRTSLTPNNAATTSDAKSTSGHQTRHTATQEEIDKAYEDGMKLYQTLRDHPRRDGKPMSTEFMHLPPRDAFPDYYALIKNKAISFTEIRLKIERRQYGNIVSPTANNGILKSISDDFKQLFFNAKRYNMKGSNIYNDARKLDRLHRATHERLAGLKSDEKEDQQQSEGEDENAKKGSSATPGVQPQARAGSSTPAAQQGAAAPNAEKPPKKKYKKTQPQLDDKPITLTKWLSNKVDDLVAMTDKNGRVLSDVFMQVPPQNQYPDYYQIIAKPISFQLVRSRLKNRNYQTIEKFKDDVNLIFSNAQTYNEDGSLIWQDAQQLKEYFQTIMQEEPPEFFVRPRNQSQQAVGSKDHHDINSDQSKYRYANPSSIQNNSYPSFSGIVSGNGDNTGSPFSMPAQNAYDTVKFGEFDEPDISMDMNDEANSAGDISVEQAQTNAEIHDSGMAVDQSSTAASPVKTEVTPQPHAQQPTQQTTQQSLPSTQAQTPSIPIPQHLAQPQRQDSPYSTATPKSIARLVDPSSPPVIKTFSVILKSRKSNAPLMTHHIANTTIRQHTLALSRDVDYVELMPVMSGATVTPGTTSTTALEARARQRTAQIYDGETSQEERSAGSYEKKWIIHLGQGLTSVEIKAGPEELYRIFLMKLTV